MHVSYLTEDQLEYIANHTHLVPFSLNYKIENFDCGIDEYNIFLTKEALMYSDANISKTHLLLDNYTGDVIGYFSLCTGAISLSEDEKTQHHMGNIPFKSMPILKIGKLAVDKTYISKRNNDMKINYGSYLIELCRGFAAELTEQNIACRFVVVDADIQHNPKTVEFYEKNGFLYNQSFIKSKSSTNTVSMRLDIYNDVEEQNEEQTGT